MVKPDERPQKPSIADLEKMLEDPGSAKIHLEPDGSITTIKPETVSLELIRLRRENSELLIRVNTAENKLHRVEKALQETH